MLNTTLTTPTRLCSFGGDGWALLLCEIILLLDVLYCSTQSLYHCRVLQIRYSLSPSNNILPLQVFFEAFLSGAYFDVLCFVCFQLSSTVTSPKLLFSFFLSFFLSFTLRFDWYCN